MATTAMGFDFLQDQLGSKKYLLGDEFSGADVMRGFTLAAARMLGVLDDQLPGYLTPLGERHAFQRTMAIG